MHDRWNPWHGCTKISEGCKHCYMMYNDHKRGLDGTKIYKTQSFYYPLEKDRYGEYKIKSGEVIRICMNSDFFLEEADPWRDEVWKIIKQRSDVIFYILTKRAHRIASCLPSDWQGGYENVLLNVTCENQRQADLRLPILMRIPAKHKGIMCAPLIGSIDLSKYLEQMQIDQIVVGGENYGSNRCNHHEWVESLFRQAKAKNIKFCFIETGTYYKKDQTIYRIVSKQKQAKQAYKSGLQYSGKKVTFHLKTNQLLLFQEIYEPHYRKQCIECGSRGICNGCSDCGRCPSKILTKEEMLKIDHHVLDYRIHFEEE